MAQMAIYDGDAHCFNDPRWPFVTARFGGHGCVSFSFLSDLPPPTQPLVLSL